MTCPICKRDDWEDISGLRDWKYWYEREYIYREGISFLICRNCGFATYDWNKDLKAEYTRQRAMAMPGHISTGNKKKEHHRWILGKMFKPGELKGKRVLDVGCAIGSMLQVYDELGVDRKNICGTEYSEPFKNVCNNLYGYDVRTEPEDFDGKFDVISWYHVLEHIQRPEKAIEQARKMLVPGGLLYISVPVWFGELEESGGAVTNDFEALYHLNHCNVWSDNGFRNFLKATGIEIVEEEHTRYGFTIVGRLCEPSDKIKPDNWQELVAEMKRHREAIRYFNEKNYQKAIEIYPQYPDAYIHWCYDGDNFKNKKAVEDILARGLAVMPDNFRMLLQLANHKIQWDQSYGAKDKYTNSIREAEAMLGEVMKRKANEETYELMGILCMRYKRDYKAGIEWYKKVLESNPGRWNECMTNILWMAGQDGYGKTVPV